MHRLEQVETSYETFQLPNDVVQHGRRVVKIFGAKTGRIFVRDTGHLAVPPEGMNLTQDYRELPNWQDMAVLVEDDEQLSRPPALKFASDPSINTQIRLW